MLDGLLNRGFSSKCKSLIKATRTRIEVVRRRTEAKQRFLKEDLAKLLTNGLDINAYGRTEEFLAGLNLLACYDFIEASCDYVVKNLTNMQKQRECPEGCREAVASLMFAAARFSDLPELRDVRDIFQQRYGSSLECFVNQKFVEKLSSKPPLMETRLQLLQDIALECSIKWDSRGFELRMTTTPSTTGQAQANKYGPSNGVANKCSLLDGWGSVAKPDKDDVLPKEIPVNNIGSKMHHGKEGNDLLTEESNLHLYKRQEAILNAYKHPNIKGNCTAANHDDTPRCDREQDITAKHERRVKKDLISSKVEKTSSSSYRRPLEGSGIAYLGQDEAKNDVHERENWNPLSRGKMSACPNFREIPDPNIKGNGTAANHDDSPRYDREQDIIAKHERRVEMNLISSKVEKTGSSSYRRPLEGSGIAYPGQDEAKNDTHERENWKPLSRGKMSVSTKFGGIPEPNIKGNGTAANHDDSPCYDREQDRIAEHERRVKMDVISSKLEKTCSASYRRPLEGSGTAYPGQDEAKNDIHERENWKPPSREKMSVSPNFGGIPGKNEGLLFAHDHGRITGNSQKEANSTKRAQNEEVDGSKPYHNIPRPPPYVKSSSNAIPPPYVKPKDSKQKTSRRSELEGPYRDEHLMNPTVPNRVDEINSSDWNNREFDNPVHEGQIHGSTRVRSHEKEHLYQDDKIPLPKPRSRRKHHKSLSNYDDVSHVEDSGTGRKSSSSRRRDQSRKGLQILMDIGHYRKDEEEKMIDKLLLHYSKKPSTYEDIGKSRKKSQECSSHQGTIDAGESSHDPKTGGYNVKPEITPAPSRSVSLPHVHSGPSGAKKIFARANSFQPDNQAPHVHPKLPDYDDLAAQFAALKGL